MAGVAQLVELQIVVLAVAGSIPVARPTTFIIYPPDQMIFKTGWGALASIFLLAMFLT
jgi:hypothetical protein